MKRVCGWGMNLQWNIGWKHISTCQREATLEYADIVATTALQQVDPTETQNLSKGAQAALALTIMEGEVLSASEKEDRGEARGGIVKAMLKAKGYGVQVADLHPVSLRRPAENKLKFRAT